MANFSTNQVKQMYIAKALNTNVATAGDIAFYKTDADELYAKFRGEGGLVRTDLIPLANITSAKAFKVTTMNEKLNTAFVKVLNAVAGQQYILKVNVRQFAGIGDEETATIIADYTAASGNAVKNVVANLAVMLAKNMKKLVYPLFKVYVTTATAASDITVTSHDSCTEVTANTDIDILTGNYTAIVLEAYPQDYRLGVLAQENVYFTADISKVISNGELVKAAETTYNTAQITAPIKNSKKIADLEYFAMGERGDIYRKINFPYNIDTKYMADATLANGYHLIEIEYFFKGTGENPQESRKELVIAVPAEGDTTYTVIDTIIGASNDQTAGSINKAAGKTLIIKLADQ